MASSTPNLSLRKPTNNDTVNVVTDLSENFDKIDAHVTSATAHSGTYVARNGVLASVTRTAAGQVSGLTDDGVAETYTRDSAGRVATITVGATTRTVTRNASGQVTGIA